MEHGLRTLTGLLAHAFSSEKWGLAPRVVWDGVRSERRAQRAAPRVPARSLEYAVAVDVAGTKP